MKKCKYLIIGNGIAGLSCVKQIKKNDPDSSIIMISKEKKNTYYRIKLTEYISEGYDINKAYVNKQEWYKDNNVTVILDKEVISLDEKNKYVTLEDGEEVIADKILLAMGASPFIPPIENVDLNGVFALRTIEDVDNFLNYVSDVDTVSVLGGGLLGLEAAYSLLKLGKKVNVVESYKYVLGRQLDEELGENLNKELTSMGINVIVGQNVKSFIGNEKVTGIKLEDGTEVKTDAILISTGVKPNIDIVKNTSIETNKGIIADKNLKTNIDGIYAAGDVVEIFGMTMGLWTAAMEMGKIAGTNMTGGEAEYEMPKLFTSLDIGDINIFSCGEVSNYDEIYKYDDEESHHRIYIKDNKAVGGVLEGNTKEKNKIKNLVFNHSEVDELNTCNIDFVKA